MLNFVFVKEENRTFDEDGYGPGITTCCKTKNVQVGTETCPNCGKDLCKTPLVDNYGVTIWNSFRFWDNGPDKNVRLTRVGKKYIPVNDVTMFLKKKRFKGKPIRYNRNDIKKAKEDMAQAVLDGNYRPRGVRVMYKELKEVISFNPKTGIMYQVMFTNGRKTSLRIMDFNCSLDKSMSSVFINKCIEYRKLNYKYGADWDTITKILQNQEDGLIHSVILLHYPNISNIVNLQTPKIMKHGFNLSPPNYMRSVLLKNGKGIDIMRRLIPGCSSKLFHLIYNNNITFTEAAYFISMFGLDKTLENAEMLFLNKYKDNLTRCYECYPGTKRKLLQLLRSYSDFSNAVGPRLLNLIKKEVKPYYEDNTLRIFDDPNFMTLLFYSVINDSVRMFGDIKRVIPDFKMTKRKTLKEIHDSLAKIHARLDEIGYEIKYSDKEISEIEHEVEDYKFSLLKNTADFAKVGANMVHCVSSYSKGALEKHFWIVVMHKNDDDLHNPALCIQIIRKKGEYIILQARRKYDARPNDAQKNLLLKWCQDKEIDSSWLDTDLNHMEINANAELEAEERRNDVKENAT
jgi:hypothetical protein